jgi:tagaturonate reductase
VNRVEKILQYGEGNFLRAFVDWMVDILNEQTDFNGSVAIVQPISRGLADLITAQDGVFTTVLRGVQNGKAVETYRNVTSVSRCLNPYEEEQFTAYRELGRSSDLRFVVSNTTEAGIAYHQEEYTPNSMQASFPANVAALLYDRYTHTEGDRSKGLVFIPCELIDKNGELLKEYVLKHAKAWNVEAGFFDWIEEACDFTNSLVDRIVPGYPRDEEQAIWEKIGWEDKLIVSGEIFHLWVIESKKGGYEKELPFNQAGLNVIWTDDMSFYRTRKVRILNGAHTMSVHSAYQAGLDTVQECIADTNLLLPFMNQGIFDEIIPVMEGDSEDLIAYAKDVLERFENPFNPHQLLSITLNSISKFKTRNLPSLLAFVEKRQALPKILTFSLASLIAFYEATEYEGSALKGKRNGETYLIQDDASVLAFFKEAYSHEGSVEERAHLLSRKTLANTDFWDQDLTKVAGLAELVETYLTRIWSDGMKSALEVLV